MSASVCASRLDVCLRHQWTMEAAFTVGLLRSVRCEAFKRYHYFWTILHTQPFGALWKIALGADRYVFGAVDI